MTQHQEKSRIPWLAPFAAVAFFGFIIAGVTLIIHDADARRGAFRAECVDDSGRRYRQAYRGADLITRDADGYELRKPPPGFRCKQVGGPRTAQGMPAEENSHG